jgi:t-SNARE complex subunit (syntaxin)
VKAGITTIKKYITDIDQFHGKALSSVSEQSDTKELDKLMDSANQEIQKVRTILKNIDDQNKKCGAVSNSTNLSADQRIRMSQSSNVTKKFVETVTEYQDVQTKYKVKYKDRLERQFKIVKPDATQAEIDKVVESGGDTSGLFAQQILMGPQHAEAKRALHDIQVKHQEIIKIEKSILEINQLFMDMAVLVNAQGEMISHIDQFVESAADHTNKGVTEIKKAVKSQKKSRKKMCCLFFLVLLIIIIIALVLAFVKK